jgi:drug/metabolite transporter (DMT)-like permease
MPDLTLGVLCGLLSGLSWAATSIIVRSLSGSLTPVSITAVRSTIGGTLLLAGVVATGYGGELLRTPLWAALALWVSMLLAMGIGDTLFFASMDHLGVTRALILGMANPLLTTLIGVGLLGEPMSLSRASGIAGILGGMTLIVAGRGERAAEPRAAERPGVSRRGLQLVLGAALAWAVSAVIVKAPLTAVSVLTATTLRFPVAGLVLWCTPWTRGTLQSLRQCTAKERAGLAVTAVIGCLGSMLYIASIKFGGVAVGNVLSSSAPFFTIPYEVLVLKQRPSRRTVLGAVLTIAGVALLQY